MTGCDKSKCSVKRLMKYTVPTLGSFYERRLSQLVKVIYKVHFFNYSLNILPIKTGNHIVLPQISQARSPPNHNALHHLSINYTHLHVISQHI